MCEDLDVAPLLLFFVELDVSADALIHAGAQIYSISCRGSMVHFGQRLARERWAPWSPHYFDYDLLKRKLKAIQNASEQSEKDQAIQDFQHALDREIEKVPAFLGYIILRLQSSRACQTHRQCILFGAVLASVRLNLVPSQVLGFYKEKSGAAKGAAEGIQRTTQIAIDEASSYSTIPAEKVVRPTCCSLLCMTLYELRHLYMELNTLCALRSMLIR